MIEERMDKELKREWLAALRSGDYGQVPGMLANKEGHCCLGVLTVLVSEKEEGHKSLECVVHEDYEAVEFFLDGESFDQNECEIPYSALRQLGIPSEKALLLMALNDGSTGHRYVDGRWAPLEGDPRQEITSMEEENRAERRTKVRPWSFAEIADFIEANIEPVAEQSAS
jgi:hypothetical protein